MANVKEQNASLKARQTKLLKKTKDELIEVILRKDKVEKNQVNQISKLKGEIIYLQSKIKNLISDNEGNEKVINELRESRSKLKDSIKSLYENIDAKSIEIEEITNKLHKTIIEKDNKIKAWTNIAITLGIALILSIIIPILR